MTGRVIHLLAGVAAAILLAGCSGSTPRSENAVAAPAPEPAPGFTLKDLSGKSVSLADYTGKVVAVDFWGTYCGPCVEAIPKLQALREELHPSGFEILGIATDPEGKAKVVPVVKRMKIRYPIVLLGKDTAAQYGVDGIPALFLVDRQGNLVRRFEGVIDHAAVEAEVRKLVGG